MLKRVKIQGYKSLVDVEVNLQPLSVLFGPNASGKSNFLDALQLLSRIATSNNLNDAFNPPYRGKPLESFTFGSTGIQGLLAKFTASFSIEVDVELSQTVIDTVNSRIQKMEGTKKAFLREKYLRYRIEIETHPKTGRLRVADEYLAALNAKGEITNQQPYIERIDDDRLHLRPEGQASPSNYDTQIDYSILSLSHYPPHYPYLVAMHQELASWFFYYLEPRERMRIPSPVREVRHIGLMGEELDAFLNTLKAIDEPQFKAVEKALHMVVPSITGIDVGVNNSGEVELVLLEGNTPIPMRVVSEGTLRILGLLALSGVKDQPSLLGFEEPENGVHPDRLDLIARLLETRAMGDTQVIVTTHSPVLVDLIPIESLYAFRQVNGKTMIDSVSNLRAKPHKPNLSNGIDKEETPVSERILRGDFDA